MCARAALWGIAAALLMPGCLWGDIANGGFENGLTGWTSQYEEDGSNWGNSYVFYTTANPRRSGAKALFAGVGLASDQDGSNDDWARLYAWSDPLDLTYAASIRLHLGNIGLNPDHNPWGYGQAIYLVLTDGSSRVRCALADVYEEPFPSLFDSGDYTTSTGDDGLTWYGFDVELNASRFGPELSTLSLSSARIGFEWECIVRHDVHEKLWSQSGVDDVSVAYVPEPGSMAALAVGATGFLIKKRGL